MAKFCSKCGKPLVEGVPCDCEKSSDVVEKVENKQEKNAKSIRIDKLVDIFKKMIFKPIDTIKEFIKKANTKDAWILILINSLVCGLSMYFCANNFTTGIARKINNLASFSSALYGKSSNSYLNMQLPFFKFVFTIFIGFLIGNLIVVLMEKLFVGKIFKTKATMKEFFIIHAVTTIINTITIVIAAICSMISVNISMLIILFGIIMYFVCISQIYEEVLNANKNKIAYGISCSFIFGYGIATVIIVLICSSVLAVDAYNYYNNASTNNQINSYFGY